MINTDADAADDDVDVDECTTSSPCNNSQICLNSYGSYVCLRTSASAAAITGNCSVLLLGPVRVITFYYTMSQKRPSST